MNTFSKLYLKNILTKKSTFLTVTVFYFYFLVSHKVLIFYLYELRTTLLYN
jgi:hypothetical protein